MDEDATQAILDSVDPEEMLRLAQDLVRIPSFKTKRVSKKASCVSSGAASIRSSRCESMLR